MSPCLCNMELRSARDVLKSPGAAKARAAAAAAVRATAAAVTEEEATAAAKGAWRVAAEMEGVVKGVATAAA